MVMTEPTDDDDFEDPLPALRAAADQAGAQAPLVATLAWANYQAFLTVGFTSKQSCWLTMAQMLQNPGRPPS
jgi:hypothetical protein